MTDPPQQKVVVNSFPISVETEKEIFRCWVNIEFEFEEGDRSRTWCWTSRDEGRTSLEFQHDNRSLVKFVLEGTIFAYNASTVLYALEPLEGYENVCVRTADICHLCSAETSDRARRSNGRAFVTIRTERSFMPKTVNLDSSSKEDLIHFLETVTSELPLSRRRYIFLGGIFVVPDQSVPTSSWCSYYNAVKKTIRLVGKAPDPAVPVVEVDSRQPHFYIAQSLPSLAISLFKNSDPHWSNEDQANFTKFMSGVRCIVRRTDNRDEFYAKPVIFIGLDCNPAHNYDDRYPREALRYPNWPAVVYERAKREYRCPIEYLSIKEMQRVPMHKLWTIPSAPRVQNRYDDITEHYKEMSLYSENNHILTAFGVRVDRNPCSVEGTWIPGYRADKVHVSCDKPLRVDELKRNWRIPIGTNYAEPGMVDNIIFLAIPHSKSPDPNTLSSACDKLVQYCRQRGMKIGNEVYKVLPRGDDMFTWIRQEFEQINNEETALVVVISTDVHEDLHDYIKLQEWYFDRPSQHVQSTTICKLNLHEKLAMKMNTKTGGLCYSTDNSLTGNKNDCNWLEDTFVIGLDVGHPPASHRDGDTPSVVGMSANTTANRYLFNGDIAFTKPMQEEINQDILENFVDWSLNAYLKHHPVPKSLFVFRDGVSDEQENEAIRELDIISNCVNEIILNRGATNPVRVTGILVRKNHNTRFFKTLDKNGSKGNCDVDTVVNRFVTTYGKRELFVQAALPLIGTAKVPSFLILQDDWCRSDSELSNIIISACSLHQITDGPTSSPTPAVVAHELAKRGAALFKINRKYYSTHYADEIGRMQYRDKPRLQSVRFV